MEKPEPTEVRIRKDIGDYKRPTRDSYDRSEPNERPGRPLRERKEKVDK